MTDSSGLEDDARVVAPGALSALLQHIFSTSRPARRPRWARPLQPGTRIGRFEVIRELGRGGFGIVYEATDREVGRTVALKTVLPGDRPGLSEERLLREAEAAARLCHPNIVTIHDVGRSAHGPYLVLERLEGETLDRRLRDHGALRLDQALTIASGIASGLAHAHSHGVVHRDLTPRNVFLCDEGAVKVLDFGMAHVFGRRKAEGGTRMYMAPEQACGAPEDERSDVFALGVMLFQMASGRLPYRRERGRHGAIRPVLDLEVSHAPAVAALVSAMLSEDPVRRPRDAGEVVGRLTAARRQVERRRDGAGPVAVRTVRRRRLGAHRRPPRNSIAVLPFADMSEHGDQRYLSEGIAEEILNALARVHGVHVAGRTSSFSFGPKRDLRAIGNRLGVGAVLDGSVRKVGERVRVSAQLVDVAGGLCVWSQTFDRELSDVFAVQEEIASAVVSATPLLRRRRPARRQRTTKDVDAYLHYLVGRQLRTRGATRANVRRAIAAFEEALGHDARFAPAWAGLAEALHVQVDYVATTASVAALRARELAAAASAVEFGPSLPDGYRQRAILCRAHCDWAGARANLEIARKLGPGDAATVREQGRLSAALGRLTDGTSLLLEAIRIDPLDPRNWYFLGTLHLAAGELAVAQDAFQRAWEVAPDSPGAPFGLGIVSLLRRDASSARSLFRRAGDRYRLLGIAMAEGELGRAHASRSALDVLTRRYVLTAPGTVAKAHAWRGELDSCFTLLERARVQHDPVLTSIKHDPLFRNAREDRRYLQLLGRMNLPVD